MAFREMNCPLFHRALIKDNFSCGCLMAKFLHGSIGSMERADELCSDYF